MHTSARTAWAERLEVARRTRTPTSPLSKEVGTIDIADAYAIAQTIVQRRVERGARVIGHKIGLTSLAVQEQLGVDQPDYGALLDEMLIPDGGVVSLHDMIAPRVELELAFTLCEPLAGPGVEPNDVDRATASVRPAIEIVDSRIADWRITFADTVADNASSGAFVLGGDEVPLDAIDPAGIHAVLERNGEAVERGDSSAVLGDPRRAVAWLANALGDLGTVLQPGEVILSGACTRMVAVTEAAAFRGDFGALGVVSVRFTAGGAE
jgi:2-keto-4-pentenoate hydratase